MKTFILMAAVAAIIHSAVALAAQTWTPTGAPGGPWRALASSADGNRLVAAGAQYHDMIGWSGFNIFVSADAGQTWTPTTAPIVARLNSLIRLPPEPPDLNLSRANRRKANTFVCASQNKTIWFTDTILTGIHIHQRSSTPCILNLTCMRKQMRNRSFGISSVDRLLGLGEDLGL